MIANRSFIFGAAIAAMIAGTGGTASAQDVNPEQAYYELQSAIVAYERCNRMRFDQAQYDALDDAIMDIIGGTLGGGVKVTLIEQAKKDTWQRVNFMSCNNSKVQQSLSLFESQLAPAIGAAL